MIQRRRSQKQNTKPLDELMKLPLYISKLQRKQYRQYINSLKWAKKKSEYFKKYPKLCMKCGNTEQLELHHATYKHLGNELENELYCLCRNCHQNYHDIYQHPTIKTTREYCELIKN